jgi:hypothetical protein
MCFTAKYLYFQVSILLHLMLFLQVETLRIFCIGYNNIFGPVLIDYYLYEKLNFNLEEEGQLCRKII